MVDRTALSEMRLLVMGALALAFLSYVTNIFLANTMGPEIFGKYSYILLVGGLLGQLTFFGTEEMAIRLKGSRGPAALNWILTVRFLNFCLLSTITFLIWLGGEGEEAFLGMIIALNSLSMATHYETQGRNLRYVSIFLLERLTITAALWVGILFIEGNYLVWILLSLALIQCISLAYQYLDIKDIRISNELAKLFIVYQQGFFILVFNLSKFAFGGVTRMLIFDHQGDRQMGIFASVWQFVPLGTLYFAQATKAWRLRITEALDANKRNDVREHILALSMVVMLPTVLSSMLLAIFGDHIIDLLFTDEFRAAAGLMTYLAIYLIVVAMDTIAVLVAISLSMLKIVSLIYIIFGGLVVIACFFVADQYGLEGYFIAIILGHLSAVVALGIAVLRALKLGGYLL